MPRCRRATRASRSIAERRSSWYRARSCSEIRMRLAADGLSGGRESMTLGDAEQGPGHGPESVHGAARCQQALETETRAHHRRHARREGGPGAPGVCRGARRSFRSHAAVGLGGAHARARPCAGCRAGRRASPTWWPAACPTWRLERVSVLDQYGRLLSRDHGRRRAGRDQPLLRLQAQLSSAPTPTASKSLLAPIIGLERVRAQVNAELDFSQNERREEAFAGAPEKMRSEQIEDQRSGSSALASGCPVH